jgi:putative restriction endonuclease
MMEALLRFDKQPIRLPEKFSPTPTFLLSHAKKFGFTN